MQWMVGGSSLVSSVQGGMLCGYSIFVGKISHIHDSIDALFGSRPCNHRSTLGHSVSQPKQPLYCVMGWSSSDLGTA